ncbi:MAG: PKD domain-containing protein [Rhodothermales bacterium]
MFLLLSPPANGQTLDYFARMGSSSYDAGEDLVLDAAGNTYLTGRFMNTVDFDPGPGIFNLTSAGGEDVFVASYDASGGFRWALGFGDTGADLGHGIALDAAGNVYVMGRFTGTADLDPDGVHTITSNGELDTFVAKYTNDGHFVWGFSFGGEIDDAGEDIAVDPSGQVYLTGGIQGTVDFDPGPGVAEFTSTGDLDIFRVKYSTDGEYLWAYVAPDAQIDNQRGFRMVVDDAGYSYVTGWFKRNPVVGTTGGEQIHSNGESDAWIGKFDPDGQYLWAFNLGATARDLGTAIAVDRAGNTIGAGFIKNTVDFDPGPGVYNLPGNALNNGYLAKYDPDGNLVWAFLLENVSTKASTQIFNIGVDDDNNYYAAGFLQGTVDFDPNGTFELTGNGPYDAFLAKYDAGGNLIWAFKVGGTNNDFGQGVDNTADGSIIVMTGRFRGTADLSVAGDGSATVASAGLDDIFLARYNQEVGNATPIASFTATPGAGALDLDLDGSASFDPDGAIVLWEWDFGDGQTGAGASTSHTYASIDLYTITLTVTDNQGKTASSVQTILVGNPPPVASFVAANVAGTRDIDVDASASTDNGTIVSWDWDFGDGSTGTGETASHSYLADGTYQVTLSVTDDGGATDQDTQDITVVAGALPPTASFTATQTAGTLEASFDASASSDSDGAIVAWSWDFGDGASGSGETTTHTYAAAGAYTVVLTVTDDDGLTDTDTQSLVVVEPGGDGAFIESGGLVVFEAEHFHTRIARSGHEWIENTAHAGYSGASAMEAYPDDGSQIKNNAETTSPEIAFNATFTTTGDYYVWGRLWAPDKNGNSVYVGFDGTLGGKYDIFQTNLYGSWEWVVFQSNSVTTPYAIASAGLHTIHFWLRKDGLILDRVVMTTDAGYVPSGTGPDESPRGASAPVFAARGAQGDAPAFVLLDDRLPDSYALEGAYPNPFNPTTTLRFALPADSPVRLIVYDAMGRHVSTLIDGERGAGLHEAVWDGTTDAGGTVASGVYLIRMQAGAFVATRNVLLLK